MTITDPPLRNYLDGRSVDACVATATILFAPLGIPLAVECEEDLVETVRGLFRPWEDEPDVHAPMLRLRLTRASRGFEGGDPEIRVEGTRILISGDKVRARADSMDGCAECSATEALIAQTDQLRREVIEPIVLFLLCRAGRTPVHAAGFLAEDIAVLLAGPSGSGKSCLALAAQAAGFPLLSDDMVFVRLQPELRIWSIPGAIHLFPEDAPPAAAKDFRVRNGKTKQAIPMAAAAGGVAHRAMLCVLERGTRVALAPLSSREATAMLAPQEPGFDLLADDIVAATEALCADGAWCLTLSDNPEEAVALLAQSLPRLASAVQR